MQKDIYHPFYGLFYIPNSSFVPPLPILRLMSNMFVSQGNVLSAVTD